MAQGVIDGQRGKWVVFWSDHNAAPITFPGVSPNGVAGLSEDGQIAGHGQDNTGIFGFIWRDGGFVRLPDIGGTTSTEA